MLGLLCFVAAAGLWRLNHTLSERAILPLADPLANLNQVGINVNLDQYDADELERVLVQISDVGFRWVRQQFPWYEIERQRGVFEWSTWDAIVRACAAHDLNLIAVLDGSPQWARPGIVPDNPLTPPLEVNDWGRFVTRFAERYRGQIAAYQLWDEPNLTDHWGNQYVDPVGYTALLREGTIHIRKADPGAVILLAALAPTIEHGPLNLNEVAFLKQVIDAGGEPFFDVVALQPYGFAQAPQGKADPARLNFARAAFVRRELVSMGLGDRPVWATAWGWNALPPEWSGKASPWPVVSVEHQVEYTMDALRMARQEWPWMGPMILYTYQPDVPSDDPRWGFAVVDAQGNVGSLYTGLNAYHETNVPLRVGAYIPREENAQYVGVWRFSPAGADPPHGAQASDRNAFVAFNFVGTSLDLTVRRGDYVGFLYITVDDKPASGLPRDEQGRAYLVLYDPSGQAETVNIARRLSANTAHHAEIVAHGGWGQWPLAGWTIHAARARRPHAISGSIGLLLAVGVGLTFVAFGQIALAPNILEPFLVFLGRVFRRYRALPEWIPVLATLVIALIFYFVPWTSLSLLCLVAIFILAFLRIDLGLATVALALPFYLKPKLLLDRPFSIVELSVWLCFTAWLSARLLDIGRETLRDGPQPLIWRLRRIDERVRTLPSRIWQEWTVLDKGMAVLILVAALSLNWVTYRQVAVREFRVVFLESTLFYALIRLAARSSRARQRIVEGWLLGTVAISLIGIGQLIAGQDLITAEGVSRVRGFYGSPNNLALYLGRALPVLLALAWQGPRHSRTDRFRRFVYGFAALPVLAALVLTLSKGALLLGLPVALLTLGWVQRSRKAIWISLGAVVTLLLLIVPFFASERFSSLFDLNSGTAFFRLKLWRSALAMIADHPFTGVGLDNFLYFYRSRYVLPSAWGEMNLSHPHNLLLDTWTRLGVSGVATVAWLLISFFRVSWQQFRTAVDNRRALLLGLIAAMVALLAHGMVDHAVFLIDLLFVFALLLAMANPQKYL
jgi:O-antigen ligase